ncbi:MAG: alpha/beta fold hydrolase [Candidatus Hodarchaeales archaeon]|jgi:sporulation protein YlmC with PRC-barrel domain/ribosomal protein S18 acetylase RimI-like enzyme
MLKSKRGFLASEILDYNVFDQHSKKIGRVNDILISPSSWLIDYIVIQKDCFVPISLIAEDNSTKKILALSQSKERLTRGESKSYPKNCVSYAALRNTMVHDFVGARIGLIKDIAYHTGLKVDLVIEKDPSDFLLPKFMVVAADNVCEVNEKSVTLCVPKNDLKLVKFTGPEQLFINDRQIYEGKERHVIVEAPTATVSSLLHQRGEILKEVTGVLFIEELDVSNKAKVSEFVNLFNEIFSTSPDAFSPLSKDDTREYFSQGTFVVHQSQKAIGYSHVKIETDEANKRIGIIAGIGVHPELRGKHVALALVDRSLNIFDLNIPALRLFSSLGFREIGETHLVSIESQSKFILNPELDAYWFLSNPECRLYRFLYTDEEIEYNQAIDSTDHLRPILLIHGYNSSHPTWNWMAQQLWKDGFRNIFALELISHTSGLPRLFEQVTKAIDYILSLLPNYEFVTLIGHSMGGMIARYYLKQEIGRQRKARLCITLGSPHHGILGLFSAFHDLVFALTKSLLPSKLELVKDFSPKGRMKAINEMIMAEDLYTTTMVNIMGSLSKYGGTDGLFRPKPVHDMVNKTLSSGHFMLHKNDASYQIIQDFLTNQAKVIKLRLLFIEVPEDRRGREKEFFFIISHEKKQWQRYPSSGYIRVKDHSLIPEEPLIIYSGMSYRLDKEVISITVWERDMLLDMEIVDQEVDIPLNTERAVGSAILTEPRDKTKFALAYVAYGRMLETTH